MVKQWTSNILRSLGLIQLADILNFRLQQISNARENQIFKKLNPNVVLPPDYSMYESFKLNYHKYYFGGKDAAEWMTDLLKKYHTLENSAILEWGCGPGRIVRHLPTVVNNGCRFYATDYNQRSIDWCKKNVNGIDFSTNKMEASLPYEGDFFDIVYGISVFTHLSEIKHREWSRELLRVLRKGGILFLTTQGRSFIQKLTTKEKMKFEKGQLVVRQKAKEGHRTFSAFQPKSFMLELFKSHDILEHIEADISNEPQLRQDSWIIRKNNL